MSGSDVAGPTQAKRRRSLTPLGETEMEVLHHVWELDSATVADVHERILRERKVAYTTIMTVMKKLSEKGFLRFDRDGASYVYSAARSPDDVREGLLRALLEKVFQGSSAALVQTLVRREDISPEEREEIRLMVESLATEDTMSTESALRDHLVKLLTSAWAHVTAEEGIAGVPPDRRGARLPSHPHTIWQLLEHLRICQDDLVGYSRDPNHVSPDFPDGYWPESDTPGDEEAWEESVAAFNQKAVG